ncbi:single Ig IL-1-related receptor-like [Liolophura sinensis]|uniref:single Ig IL-1-related receptor-like n=1 Tax=Liolophura sinensis TaxID=3198878 RepID=UPI003158E31E
MEGLGESIAGERVRGIRVISILTVVNASVCMAGEYVCQARVGQCKHNNSVYLGCPKFPSFSHTQYNFGNSCCPEIVPVKMQSIPLSTPINIAAPAVLAGLLALVAIVLPIVVYKRSRAIQIWFKYWFGAFEDDDGKLYDVYVSFDIEDQTVLRFVLCNIREFLQQNDYTAFVFPVDSQPGMSKSDNIVEAMNQCRRVMVIFSQSYRSCEWCRFEFLTAQRLFIGERLKIIPVLLGETNKRILKDDDFSTVLKFIPSIHMSTDCESPLSPSASKQLKLRMPRKRRKEACRRSCSMELRTCRLQS